ncbi:transcription factor IBH1-like [Malania oleifera]|uniref:transcription factor IBH1-like n=1 Tax=Malania oleifera TaxID=397392 RepID=UPI0025AE8ADC|nr:transcription factor IBH1-like [Malania oleifera]
MAREGFFFSRNTTNNSALKARFTRRFLRYLARIKTSSPSSSSEQETMFCQRCRRIKSGAYSSMALVVGSKRAWSRAVIRKLRKRRGFAVRNVRVKVMENRTRRSLTSHSSSCSGGEVARLRKLVPGGKGMDFCDLLEETAHYIECLATQVQVMQSIADRSIPTISS